MKKESIVRDLFGSLRNGPLYRSSGRLLRGCVMVLAVGLAVTSGCVRLTHWTSSGGPGEIPRDPSGMSEPSYFGLQWGSTQSVTPPAAANASWWNSFKDRWSAIWPRSAGSR